MKPLLIKSGIKLLFLIYSVNLLVVSPIEAKVVINEVLSNPSGTEAGAEWVELYNTENLPAPLTGCILYLDASYATQKVVFDQEDFIDKFKVVSWDNSWLNNSGDTIKIDCGSVLDSVSYGDETGAIIESPGDGVSFGRSPDGVGNFIVLSNITLGEANSNPVTETPIPTNTNTPTPKATPTPKPTSTDKPSPTAKPTSTPNPSVTSAPVNSPISKLSSTLTPTKKIDSTITEVLSAQTENSNSASNNSRLSVTKEAEISNIDNITGETKMLNTKQRKFPIAATLLISFGFIILGCSLVPFIINYKKKN
jgi:hypothetical protein